MEPEAWEKLLELAVQQGIWAALYIYLFFRMLKENSTRESKYQEMITRLSDNIETGINRIQTQLEQIQKYASDDK